MIVERRVAAMRVVPALDEVEDRHPRLDLGLELAPVEQLAFQGGEKALAHGVVETVADRTHRGSHPGLLAAHAEGDRGVLSTLVGMMDHLDRPALPERHVQSLDTQFRAQMSCHHPATHSATERVEYTRAKKEPPPA